MPFPVPNSDISLAIAVVCLVIAGFMAIPHSVAWMKVDPKAIKTTSGQFIKGMLISVAGFVILGLSFLGHPTGETITNVVNGPDEGRIQETRPVPTQNASPPNPPREIPDKNKTAFYLALGLATVLIIMIYCVGNWTKELGRDLPTRYGLKETGTNVTNIAFIAAIALTALITYIVTN